MAINLFENIKPKWLLEQDTFEENIDSLKEAIIECGFGYKTVDFRPFGGSDKDILNLFLPEDCIICYGSLGLSKMVSQKAKWVPGVWCNLEHFECTHYYNHFGKHLLNDHYIMLPYGEMLRQKQFLLDTLAEDGCLFVRPSSGFKLFSGTLIKAETYEKDVEYLGFYDVEPDRIVVVSNPKNIGREWRLIVVDKVVVSSSQYKNNGLVKLEEGCPKRVEKYGNELAQIWQPDLAFTLDICEMKDGELKLVEINSFSSSGFYVAPKKPIVMAAAELALKEWKEYHE